MSIANEITRLQNAKASIKTAINSKGGNLTNELIDQYANAIDNIATAKEEETKTVTNPDFSLGDIEVTPTTGKVMTKVMINKDVTNHKAENIKKDITLYGITGNSFIAIELTQAQYDALGTKDSNTYYLIVEDV